MSHINQNNKYNNGARIPTTLPNNGARIVKLPKKKADPAAKGARK